MSTDKSKWTNGQAIMVEDQNVAGELVAGAPDRAFEVLGLDQFIAAGAVAGVKTIMPLMRGNDPAGYYTFGGTGANASLREHILAAPSSTFTGGTDGKVGLGPAVYVASAVPADVTAGASKIVLSHTQFGVLETALVGANASGSTKYIAVYGTIAYANATTGARLIRDANDNESTQTVVLTQKTTLTLGMTSQQTSKANALAAVPADGAGAYSFLIAYVVVGNGYVSGTLLGLGVSSGSTAYIEQAWEAAGIPRRNIRELRAGTVATSSAISGQAILLSSRFRSRETVLVPFKHTTNPQIIVLDQGINYARRHVTIRMAIPPADGGLYKSPDNVATVTNAGVAYEAMVQAFTGTENQTFKRITLNAKNYDFKTDASGYLSVTCGAAPNDNVNGDNWWCEIEATDSFDKSAF